MFPGSLTSRQVYSLSPNLGLLGSLSSFTSGAGTCIVFNLWFTVWDSWLGVCEITGFGLRGLEFWGFRVWDRKHLESFLVLVYGVLCSVTGALWPRFCVWGLGFVKSRLGIVVLSRRNYEGIT